MNKNPKNIDDEVDDEVVRDSQITAIMPVGNEPEPTLQIGSLKRFAIRMLGGDLIAQSFLRRNWGMIALVLVLTMVYISNRYMAEQELIRINDLQRELNEMRFRSLTHSSELTRRCRQSNIENALRSWGDTTLLPAKEPPFIIRINK